MIFVVDDESVFSESARVILSSEGYDVAAFESAGKALEKSAEEEPEMVLTDIMMPGMSGFEFKEAYDARFPFRQTPFVFLSSLSDPEEIVRGLDLGADDYLTKPINAEILKAKVRSILGRKKRYSTPVFRGDLSKLPFVSLLQFCEAKGLTGEVEIASAGDLVRIRVKGGDLVIDDLEDSALEQLYDRTEGTFVIYSQPVDFSDIGDAAIHEEKKTAPGISDKDKPMGRLSGVKVQNMLFQLQTEFITLPGNQVVTIVILDGKVMMKRKTPVPPDRTDRKSIEDMIEVQHRAVEKEVREKVDDLIRRKTEVKDSPRAKFTRLFEEGFDHYREGDYDKALATWEEAHDLDPSDKILDTNIKMLRRKLKMD